MCIEDGNSIPLPSEIQLLQSMINFLKEQVFIFKIFQNTFLVVLLVRTTSSNVT